MNLRRLVILLVSAAGLSGLVLFGYLLSGSRTAGLAPNSTLIQHLQAAPLAWGYALASVLLLISFLIWLPVQLPVWRLRSAFRQLDSSSLDNDPALCRRFYAEALAFRVRYGEKRFVRQIIGRFDFFYDYHNDALRWMNDIVKRTAQVTAPTEFILTCICSGQIGRIYSNACYGGGLASAFVKDNEPIFLHARMDRIEIWSATSATPICMLTRQPLELEQGQQRPDYISCYLNGLQKSTRQPLRLELRCLTPFSDRPSEHISPVHEQMQALHSWIEDLTCTLNHSEQHNFGIDVAEIDEQGHTYIPQAAATLLTQQLQQILGSHIDGFFHRATLPVFEATLPLDAVVLCSGLGVVTITDISLSGSVSYSGDHSWTHIDAATSRSVDNACLRARHAKTAVANLLSTHGLIKWPVQSLVVFSHPDVSLNLVVGRQRVQCDVIKLAELPNWFASQTPDDTIRFTKDDYNRFIALLDPARGQVGAAMRA